MAAVASVSRTVTWFGPIVRALAAVQSLPTPNTHELARVVVSAAVGAPGLALPDPVAPMAPEPPVPDESTPVKVTTVIEAVVDGDSVAVTLTPDS